MEQTIEFVAKILLNSAQVGQSPYQKSVYAFPQVKQSYSLHDDVFPSTPPMSC